MVGDHGYHVGQKRHFGKNTLWREACRVPFIFAGPDVPSGKVVKTACSTIHLGATLTRLAGVPLYDGGDSRDISSVWSDEANAIPAITSHLGECFAVSSRAYRYLLYQDGSEELYDIESDPFEQTNLTGDSAKEEIKAELRVMLPEAKAPPVPSMGAYQFDERRYSWSETQPRSHQKNGFF